MVSKIWNRHLPVVLLVISVALNVVFARQLHALRQPVTSLQPGERVPPLDVTALDGTPVRISFDGATPTLLYYFSPTCTWCERNWANVRTILNAGEGRVRVIGLSTTAKGVEQVLTRHDVRFDVYTGVSAQTMRAYHFGGTPNSILVSPAGIVLRSWPGAYRGALAAGIEKYFVLKLPGLAGQTD